MVFCAWPRESNGEEQCWGKGVTARFFYTKLDSEILICVEKKSFLQNFQNLRKNDYYQKTYRPPF